jgi:hypothetical protein
VTLACDLEEDAMSGQHQRTLLVQADLLDRQLVDEDERLLGKVDDLELTDPADGRPPQVTAILTGPDAFNARVSRRYDRWRLGRRRRHGAPERIATIPFFDVRDIGMQITVRGGSRGYEGSETTLRDRFIDKIPGARHADE